MTARPLVTELEWLMAMVRLYGDNPLLYNILMQRAWQFAVENRRRSEKSSKKP